jgi:hypothetical protein
MRAQARPFARPCKVIGIAQRLDDLPGEPQPLLPVILV